MWGKNVAVIGELTVSNVITALFYQQLYFFGMFYNICMKTLASMETTAEGFFLLEIFERLP